MLGSTNQNLNALNVEKLNYAFIYNKGVKQTSFRLDSSGIGYGDKLCLDNLAIGSECGDYELDVSGTTRMRGNIDASLNVTLDGVITINNVIFEADVATFASSVRIDSDLSANHISCVDISGGNITCTSISFVGDISGSNSEFTKISADIISISTHMDISSTRIEFPESDASSVELASIDLSGERVRSINANNDNSNNIVDLKIVVDDNKRKNHARLDAIQTSLSGEVSRAENAEIDNSNIVDLSVSVVSNKGDNDTTLAAIGSTLSGKEDTQATNNTANTANITTLQTNIISYDPTSKFATISSDSLSEYDRYKGIHDQRVHDLYGLNTARTLWLNTWSGIPTLWATLNGVTEQHSTNEATYQSNKTAGNDHNHTLNVTWSVLSAYGTTQDQTWVNINSKIQINDSTLTGETIMDSLSIGTTSTDYPLMVGSSTDINSGTSGYNLIYNATYPQPGRVEKSETNSISISAQYCIWAIGFLTQSDRRIKEHITDVDDKTSLQKLRDIPCRFYTYKDKISRGDSKTIGFIAQEVKEHLPIAVSLQTAIIPNELRIIESPQWSIDSGKHKLTISDLDNSGTTLYRFYVANDPSKGVEKEVMSLANDPKSFIFDASYSNVFIYGKTVHDFHALEKEHLFSLNFSATKEIDKLQQVSVEKIYVLEADNVKSRSRLYAIDARLTALGK